MVETKKSEVRFVTDDPKRMLGKYLVKNVEQVYNEDYVDGDTGETVTIERHQLLFEKGAYIDQDLLANIMFYIQSGDIKSVEVSNQKRMASEFVKTGSWPFLATAVIGGKTTKFLTYATSIINAIEILRDYIELNYFDSFGFSQIKAYDNCIILTDNLKPLKDKNEEAEEFGKDEEEEDKKAPVKKFYHIESKIKYDDETELDQTFVVNTYDVERAMLLIELYLKNVENIHKQKCEERGETYELREPHPSIEAVKPISVNCYVPEEFSNVYIKAEENDSYDR